MEPNISVLITTYNSGKYLAESIMSVLEQSYSNFEIVVVDDGSTDATRGIVTRFSDVRINYFYINHVGRSKALNYGIDKCKYDWIAILDADDLWGRRKLEVQKHYLTKKTNFVICFSAFFSKNQIVFTDEDFRSSRNDKKKNDSTSRIYSLLSGLQ